jgi:peptidoglycan LD-endopeptidase LytH
MRRFLPVGIGILLAGLLLVAALVFVNGPGWSTSASDAGSGPLVARAPAPPDGSLHIPVAGVARTALVDNWRDPHGARGRHRAIDIAAPAGTPVIAAADGRIEKLVPDERGAAAVYQRSQDGGTVYHYAALDHYLPSLAEGQAVKAGQPIGTVDERGRPGADTSHLHFEVRRMASGEAWWQGTPVNPYPLLKGAG